MTEQRSPDPDPHTTPGLEPGGSVPPGETPPAETSATSELAREQEPLPSRGANWLVIGIVVALALVVAGFFVGRALLL